MIDPITQRRRWTLREPELCSAATLNRLTFPKAPVINLIKIIIQIEGVLEVPEEEYEIEYVYGFRTFDTR